MYVSDLPISKSEQDTLRRTNFSNNLGKSLINWMDETSIVIGLYGKWGSGKSSIINLASTYISDFYKKDKSKAPIIVYFNPWNFSEQEKLVSTFLHELAKSINRSDPSEEAQKVGKELIAYSRFFSETLRIPLELAVSATPYAPILLPIAKLFGKVFKDTGEATKAWGDLKEKTVEQFKEDLSKNIKDLKRKIIVIIDDIDRLNNKEVRQIFQLVKANANFPNVIYLLPFDRSKVSKVLEEDSFPGKEYIEKIVQIPFDVPVVEQVKLDRILFQELDKLIKPIPEEMWDQKHWGNMFYGGFQKFFISIRQIKRFMNSLEFNFSHIPDEVNPVDFIALEALRVFVPEVYGQIWGNKRTFTELDSSYSRNSDQRKKKIKEIIDLADEEYREAVGEILNRLFPQITSGHGSDWLEEWNKKRRVCSEEVFDRYFLLEIPENEISQKEISAIVKDASNSDAVEKKLLVLQKDNKAKNFLEKLVLYKDEVPEKDILPFVVGVFNAIEKLPRERGSMSALLDSVSWGKRIGYHMFKRYKTNEEKLKNILSLVKQTKSIEVTSNFVSIEVCRDEKEKDNHEYLIDEKDIPKVKEAMLSRIREEAKKGDFPSVSKLVYILYFWAELSNTDEVKKWVEAQIKTDKGLARFIEGFMWSQSSQSMGDNVSVNKWKVNNKFMEKFTDTKLLRDRVNKLNEKGFTENQKLAITLFKDAFDKKYPDW